MTELRKGDKTMAWELTGNAIGSNDFLGTTNNQTLVIKTNNTEQLHVGTNGNVGIGTSTPYVKLQVAGGGVATDSFFAFSHVQSVAPPWGVYISAPRNDTLGLFTRGSERFTMNNREKKEAVDICYPT